MLFTVFRVYILFMEKITRGIQKLDRKSADHFFLFLDITTYKYLFRRNKLGFRKTRLKNSAIRVGSSIFEILKVAKVTLATSISVTNLLVTDFIITRNKNPKTRIFPRILDKRKGFPCNGWYVFIQFLVLSVNQKHFFVLDASFIRRVLYWALAVPVHTCISSSIRISKFYFTFESFSSRDVQLMDQTCIWISILHSYQED